MSRRSRLPPLALCLATLCGGASLAATVQVTVLGPAGQALADAAVVLEPAKGRVAPKPLAGAELSQQDRQFRPSVLVVPVGTRIDFPNRDTVRHHVYSFSDAKTFEIKLYVGRPAAPILFDKPGVVTLGCNIHDSMIGWIVVADSPWYAVSRPGSPARIDDVPAGSYRLRTWHPVLRAGAPGPEQPVQVGTGDLSLTVRLEGAAP